MIDAEPPSVDDEVMLDKRFKRLWGMLALFTSLCEQV
jgi:hypothetical protein